MRVLQVDNYIIEAPLIEVISQLRLELNNGKLRNIKTWHSGENNITVTCPHHAGGHENTPACNIYIGDDTKIEYGYFKCWVCNEQGSFIKFVSECFDSSEDFAKNWLIKKFGIFSKAKISLGDDIPLQKSVKSKSSYLDKSILDTYQNWHPYLAQRKLSRDVCELFQVKYDPKLRQVIFPCFDTNDNLIMLPSRSIDYKTFYISKDIEKPVYCLDFVQKNNYSTVIITEGPIDVLTAYSYGYPAIGTFGNPSDYQIDLINKSCIKVLYLMFDNDITGEKITNRLKNQLDKRIILKQVKFINNKKDINDLTFEEFQTVIQKAKNS